MYYIPTSSSIPCCDVLPLLDLGDVFGHGGIGSDAVGIHETDEFGFSQVVWRRGLSFKNFCLGGFEKLAFLEVGELLAAFPLVVHIYVEVVPFQDDQAICVE